MVLPTFTIEEILWAEGYSRILGIDEVGRGSFAGPLYVGGVIFPGRVDIANVRDSKLLSEKQRNEVVQEIYAHCEYATGFAHHFEIDELGLTAATKLAIERLVLSLENMPDIILVDDGGYSFTFDAPVRYLKSGDKHVMSIAAGSIVAKVERDRVMTELANKYPEYAFESNKGYASKLHREMLHEHGPCEIHRKSFAPIQALIQKTHEFTT